MVVHEFLEGRKFHLKRNSDHSGVQPTRATAQQPRFGEGDSVGKMESISRISSMLETGKSHGRLSNEP